MKDDSNLVSEAMKLFQSEAPEVAAAWGPRSGASRRRARSTARRASSRTSRCWPR
ncbi:MAG: hypothetical protein M5U28_37560 [Sandaracinaceae bacterium]|nr:hypothetical protein [Sandaracinaceae bacterium]